MGVLYVLDEPSIGLHPRDNDRLIRTLTPPARPRQHRARRRARRGDHPRRRPPDRHRPRRRRARRRRGLRRHARRGAAAPGLRHRRATSRAAARSRCRRSAAAGNGDCIRDPRRAREQPQAASTSTFPLGKFIVRHRRLRLRQVHARQRDPRTSAPRARAERRARAPRPARRHRPGLEHLDKVDRVDQSPIGRTPRSNPATYTQALHADPRPLRQVPEARARGYQARPLLVQREGRPLRGVQGRRLQPDRDAVPRRTSRSPARSARATRYNREALEILFRGKNIADVLDMTVDEALEFFDGLPRRRGASCRR